MSSPNKFKYLESIYLPLILKEGDKTRLDFLKIFSLWNKKDFRISDSPISYRYINYLNENGVFIDNRKDKKEWRKLNAIDLIFLEIIKRLRKIGIDKDYLIKLRDLFYPKKTGGVPLKLGLYLAFQGIGMFLVINGKTKKIKVCDFIHFSYGIDERDYDHSCIAINLNNVLESIKQLRAIVRNERLGSFREINNLTKDWEILGYKEKEIVGIIRARDYKSLEIKETNEKYLVKIKKSEKILSGEDVKEAINKIKKRGFGKVSSIIQDNNEVGIETEETIKI